MQAHNGYVSTSVLMKGHLSFVKTKNLSSFDAIMCNNNYWVRFKVSLSKLNRRRCTRYFVS